MNGHQQESMSGPEADINKRLEEWDENPPKDIPDMMKFYKDWAATYETEKISVQYTAPKIVAEYFDKHAKKHGLKNDCRILDVAAGTGWVGEELKKLGYNNVDGLEPCEEMFQPAKDKNVYKKYILAAAGDNIQMPIQDDEYDATVIAGSLPHVKVGGLKDMIRVLRKGGLFVCAGKINYVEKNAPWMMPTLDQMMQDGLIEKLEIDIPPVCYYKYHAGLVLIYKKK